MELIQKSDGLQIEFYKYAYKYPAILNLFHFPDQCLSYSGLFSHIIFLIFIGGVKSVPSLGSL